MTVSIIFGQKYLPLVTMMRYLLSLTDKEAQDLVNNVKDVVMAFLVFNWVFFDGLTNSLTDCNHSTRVHTRQTRLSSTRSH